MNLPFSKGKKHCVNSHQALAEGLWAADLFISAGPAPSLERTSVLVTGPCPDWCFFIGRWSLLNRNTFNPVTKSHYCSKDDMTLNDLSYSAEFNGNERNVSMWWPPKGGHISHGGCLTTFPLEISRANHPVRCRDGCKYGH